MDKCFRKNSTSAPNKPPVEVNVVISYLSSPFLLLNGCPKPSDFFPSDLWMFNIASVYSRTTTVANIEYKIPIRLHALDGLSTYASQLGHVPIQFLKSVFAHNIFLHSKLWPHCPFLCHGCPCSWHPVVKRQKANSLEFWFPSCFSLGHLACLHFFG